MEFLLLKSQLTKGCGNNSCKNQYCFSSPNYKGGFYKDQDIQQIYDKMGKLCLCPPTIQQILCRWSNFQAFNMADAWSTPVQTVTDEMLNSITRYQVTQQTNFLLLVEILSCHLTTYDDMECFLMSHPNNLYRSTQLNKFFIQILLELEQDDLNIQRDNEIIELKGDVTMMIQKLLEIIFSNCYFLTREMDSYTRKKLPSNGLITLMLYLPAPLMARSNIAVIAVSSMIFGYTMVKKEKDYIEYFINFVLKDKENSIYDMLKRLIQGCNQYVSVTLSLYDKPQKAVSTIDILKIKNEYLQVIKLMQLIYQQINDNIMVKTALTTEQSEKLLKELKNQYINSSAYNITPDVDYWLQLHPYELDVSALPLQWQMIMRGQRRQRNFNPEMFTILDFPFILNAGTKRQIFRYDISCNLPHMTKIAVSRDNIVNDTLRHILDLCRDFDSNDAKAPLRVPMQVIFIGEEGIDAGGLSNEFFELICDQAFSQRYSLFKYYEEQQIYYFHKYPMLEQEELKLQYTFIGIIFGLAMANCVNIANELPDFVYKHILGQSLQLSDLKFIDEQLYTSLQFILSYDNEDLDSILCTTFSVQESVYGENIIIDLIPNGRNIEVTQNNKQEYVNLRWRYEIITSVQQQLNYFTHGFLMVTQCSTLNLFTPKELHQAVSGEALLDFEALKTNTTYEQPFSKDHRIIIWFWDILINRFNDEDRRNFMKFTFGSSRAPAGGLSRQAFKVQKNGTDDHRLPTSHTCFGILMLPEYSSKEVLEKQLRLAIINNEGFGLQ